MHAYAFVSQVSAKRDLEHEHIILYNVRCVTKCVFMSQRALSAEADSQRPAISGMPLPLLKLVQQLQKLKLTAGNSTCWGQQAS